MNFIDYLQRPVRDIDRERLVAFARYVWQRFVADGCFAAAGTLSYTTLFALVPLSAVIFGILSAFPVFQEWSEWLQEFVFSNFVPEAGRAVQEYIQTFADNASRMTSLGIVTLIISAIVMMASVEDAYNRIWRIHTARTAVARFVVYWTVLTLGPVLVVASLGISSYLFSMPLFSEAAEELRLTDYVLRSAPFLVAWAAFSLSYIIIPNRTVKLGYAVLGGLIAAVLFDLTKRGFAFYLSQVPSYQQIYGALAVVPIFLIWIYLSWVVVLLGASLTASFGSFRFQSRSRELPAGREFVALVRVVGHLHRAQLEGRGLVNEDLRQVEPLLSDDMLEQIIDRLHRQQIIDRTELGCWLLARDLGHLSLLELYQRCGYALPLDYGERKGEGLRDDWDRRLAKTLTQISGHTRRDLDHPLIDVYEDAEPGRAIALLPSEDAK